MNKKMLHCSPSFMYKGFSDTSLVSGRSVPATNDIIKNYEYPDIFSIETDNQDQFDINPPSEMTIMGYILRMQEIAARASVDEKHTVRCIIDGFHDRSVNIAVLYPAQNLQQLKELARSYQHLRDRSAAAAPASVPKLVPTSVTTSGYKSAQDAKPTAAKSMGSDGVNCCNCSGKGHISSMCPLPNDQLDHASDAVQKHIESICARFRLQLTAASLLQTNLSGKRTTSWSRPSG